MKLFVKTLKGTNFEIEASPEASVAEVKRVIESTQGQNVYPADQQMLIHQGKILKDDTTLEGNKVAENSFLVIMMSKNRTEPRQLDQAIHQRPSHLFLQARARTSQLQHILATTTVAIELVAAETLPLLRRPLPAELHVAAALLPSSTTMLPPPPGYTPKLPLP